MEETQRKLLENVGVITFEWLDEINKLDWSVWKIGVQQIEVLGNFSTYVILAFS